MPARVILMHPGGATDVRGATLDATVCAACLRRVLLMATAAGRSWLVEDAAGSGPTDRLRRVRHHPCPRDLWPRNPIGPAARPGPPPSA